MYLLNIELKWYDRPITRSRKKKKEEKEEEAYM
jgi:hypothetical protein